MRRRRIAANATGKVYVLLGAPFNIGAYVDQPSAFTLTAGSDPHCLTHAYEIKVGKSGIEATKQQSHDTQQQRPAV